jgi:hypothetical protein
MKLQFRLRRHEDYWTVEYRRKLPIWLKIKDKFKPVQFNTQTEAVFAIKQFINNELPKPLNSSTLDEIQAVLMSIETIGDLS